MDTPTIRIPVPAPGDARDVSEAVLLARAAWDKGDHREAVRWVRHAVEAADEAGDEVRVAALARAVADLGTASTQPPPPLSRRPLPPPSLRPTPPPLPSRPPAPLPRSAPPPAPSELRRRVSVKTSVRDPGLLVVRPLAEGQSAPPGTREAFLVMVNPVASTAR